MPVGATLLGLGPFLKDGARRAAIKVVAAAGGGTVITAAVVTPATGNLPNRAAS